MLKTSYVPVNIQGSADTVHSDLIPRLYDVRRVPVCYHRALPLPVVKRYQCVVLGASARALTVGITQPESEALLDYLRALTGATIFPVLVEPRRMRLLIARIERHQRFSEKYRLACYGSQQATQVRLILAFRERKAR